MDVCSASVLSGVVTLAGRPLVRVERGHVVELGVPMFSELKDHGSECDGQGTGCRFHSSSFWWGLDVRPIWLRQALRSVYTCMTRTLWARWRRSPWHGLENLRMPPTSLGRERKREGRREGRGGRRGGLTPYEGVPSFRLCASLFLYILQKVEEGGRAPPFE